MKAKAICSKENIKKRFFLLMIAPLLIGLMISLTNFARAEWTSKDPTAVDPLLKNPSSQGWKQIKIYHTPPAKKKIDLKS